MTISLRHRFVDQIPDLLEDNVIYVSIPYCTAIHKCICGCGMEVVTPLSPTDWKFTFDGKSISLFPSIGNWSFDCRSHYWIKQNQVILAASWDEDEVASGRKKDRKKKKLWYKNGDK